MSSGTPVLPTDLPAPLLGSPRNYDLRAEAARMESGRLRLRPLDSQRFQYLQAVWNFVGDQYATFRSWFRDDLENGSISFEMPTSKTDESEETVEEFAFWQGQFQLSRQGNLFVVTALLEVVESQVNEIIDLCAIGSGENIAGDSFECYYAGYTGPFSAGNGWGGVSVDEMVTGVAIDTFEQLEVGASSSFHGGGGWATYSWTEESVIP